MVGIGLLMLALTVVQLVGLGARGELDRCTLVLTLVRNTHGAARLRRRARRLGDYDGSRPPAVDRLRLAADRRIRSRHRLPAATSSRR